MMEEAPPDIKRRRISAADGSPRGIRCLTDLPSGILAHAASFLAVPSMSLFAIALDDDSAASPNERSSAIVGNHQWATLDFGEIENELAIKLKDDDISALLLCIDAVNNVKRLKLTDCVNITGAGLEPLRGSIIIEQIDLSLVGEQQNPNIYPEPPISCDLVLPILDSIIEREGCSLTHLQFPLVWREEPSAESEFHAFILRYNQMRRTREEISCLECNQNRPGGIHGDISSPDYGTHLHTCYGCMKHYCYRCIINGERRSMISDCHICKRDYCVDCTKMHPCLSCNGRNCNDCYEYECHNCNDKFCSECVEEGDGCYQCYDCDKVFCVQCEETGMSHCHECNNIYCNDCRLQKFRQGQRDCAECINLIAPLLVGECTRLYEENEQLKVKNKELTRDFNELKLRD